MFKFGGWRASLSFSGPSRRKEVYENGPDLSVGGAYRSHREEFLRRNSFSEPSKKLTPSMVKLPPSNDKLKNSKSTNDLTEPHLPPQLRRSAQEVSTDPRGGTSDNRNSSVLHKNIKNNVQDKQNKKLVREQKNAEKLRIAEQKKSEKLAREQAKKDKLRIKQEKKIAEKQAKDVKARKEKAKKLEPQPLPQASASKGPVPPPQPAQRANPLAQANYSTNTLESSISRSSGPPPYPEPKPPEKRINKKDITGNTSFGKPIEDSSWELISDHRSQMTRNNVTGSSSKQMVMDLQFSFDKAQAEDKNNSEV